MAAGRLLILLGTIACLLDAFTTWVALRAGGFHEHTAATAALIAALGLPGGLVLSVLIRIAAFAVLAFVASRIPPLATPLAAVGFVAVAITWFIALTNIATLAAPR